MKFTIFLGNEDLKSIEDLEKVLIESKKYSPVEEVKKLPFNGKLFIKRTKNDEPLWLNFFKGHFKFDPKMLISSSSSLVLILKKSDKIFIITFGYGYSSINKELVVRDFGIKVALNSVDENKIKIIDSFSVNSLAAKKAKHKRVFINSGTRVAEFELKGNSDWVRMISGVTNDHSLAKYVSGTDSINITVDISIQELEDKCNQLYETYLSDNYKKKYGFIDNIQYVTNQYTVDRLNDILKAKIEKLDFESFYLVPPKIEEKPILYYTIRSKRIKVEKEELHLNDIFQFIKDNNVKEPLKDVKLIEHYSEIEKSVPYSLIDYISFETEYTGYPHFYFYNKWIKVSKFYREEVDKYLENTIDITDELKLSPYNISSFENEGEYNESLEKENNWLLLDKELYREVSKGMSNNSAKKMEVADLLTNKNYFICVKKMSSSASLSHLFSQGSVSAGMLKLEKNYKEFVMKKYAKHFKNPYNENIIPTFVFAMITSKDDDLKESIYFFSKMNFMYHAELIKSFGYNVALCKIVYK